MTHTAIGEFSATPASDPETRVGTGFGIRVSRRISALATAFAAALIPMSGFGGLGTPLALLLFAALIALAVAPSSRRSSDRLGLLEYLPVAFVYALLAITVVGMVSSWTMLDIWAGRLPAMVTWILLVTAPAVVAGLRGGDVRVASRRTTAALFAGSLAFVWAPVLALPFEQWARSVTIGTDFPRHVVIVQSIGADGGLDYASDAYPRSAHASIALLQRAAGDLTDYTSTWQATHVGLLLMIGLMAFATAMIASRAAAALRSPSWLSSYVAPTVALALVLTGLWVGYVLPSGYFTTVQAGLIIASAGVLLWDSLQPESPSIIIGLIAMTAALAHSWLLLVPVLAIPAVWLAISGSRRRSMSPVALAVAGAAALVVAAPVVLASVTEVGLSAVGMTGGTTVPRPGLQWLALLFLAAYGAWLVSRRCNGGPGGALMLMLISLLGVELFLLSVRQFVGGSWYYVIKTAWTPLAIILGLSVPAVLWVCHRAGQRLSGAATQRWSARTLGPIALGVAALAAVSWPAPPQQAVAQLWGIGTQPAVTAPLMSQFLEVAPSDRVTNYIVWGLSPDLEAAEVSIRHAGFLDFVSVGALFFAGHPPADFPAAYPAIIHHDPVAFCEYLRDNPSTGRITGPMPSQSLGWLTDAGCPADVVRPDEWLSVDIGPEWFTDTFGQETPVGQDYPTWEQSKAVVSELKAN